VASSLSSSTPGCHPPLQADDLLLRELNHRCGNDLQLVVSLLALQSRRATNPEVRAALADTMERVSILALARHAMHRDEPRNLQIALQRVCDALHAHAEPRSILIALEAADEVYSLSAAQITTLALVVNELMTNAIKHAFEEGTSGHIRVSIIRSSGCEAVILVDDDGQPFSEDPSSGLGMRIVKRLLASVGGLFVPPLPGSKVFELRVPAS
jgi:two-component sensor histidine kinase